MEMLCNFEKYPYIAAIYLVAVGSISLLSATDIPANVALDILRGRAGEYTAAEIANLTATAAPGISYPNITKLPEDVSFRCANVHQTGYYADPDYGCQVYYRCELNSPLYTYLCPVGKLFNQIILNCDWWYNVQCERSPQFYDYSNPRLYLGPNVTFLQNANDGNVTYRPTAASALPGFVSQPDFDTAQSRSLPAVVPDIKDASMNTQKILPMYFSGPDNRVSVPSFPPQPQQNTLNTAPLANNPQTGVNSAMPNLLQPGHRQSVAGLFNSKTLRRRLSAQPNIPTNNQARGFTSPTQNLAAPSQPAFLPFTSTPQSSFKSIHPPVPQQSPTFTETSVQGGDLLSRNRLLFSRPPSQRTQAPFADADQQNLRRLVVNDKLVPTMSPAVQTPPVVTPFPFHQSAVPTEVFIPTIPASFTQNLPSNFQLMSEPQQLDTFNHQAQNQPSGSPNIISQIFDPQNRNDAFPSSFDQRVDQPSEKSFSQDFNPSDRNFRPDSTTSFAQPFNQRNQPEAQPDARMGDWVLPNFDSNFLPAELNRQLSVHSDFMNTWIPFTDPDPSETTTRFPKEFDIEEQRRSSTTSGYFTVSHQDDLGQLTQSVQSDDDYQPTSGMFRLFSGKVTRPIDTEINRMSTSSPVPADAEPQTFTGRTEGSTAQDNGLFQRLQFAHSNSSEDNFLSDPNANY